MSFVRTCDDKDTVRPQLNRVLTLLEENPEFIPKFAADQNITIDEINTIIKNYPLIKARDRRKQEILKRIIFQEDAPQVNEQEPLRMLQDILHKNQAILNDPTKITEHDFQKLFKILLSLKDDINSYGDVGGVLSPYSEQQINNLVKQIGNRLWLLEDKALIDGGVAIAGDIERFIQDAQ